MILNGFNGFIFFRWKSFLLFLQTATYKKSCELMNHFLVNQSEAKYIWFQEGTSSRCCGQSCDILQQQKNKQKKQ